MKETRKCAECEKVFECEAESKKKYCCQLCDAKWHARNNYHTKYKFSPEYKKERTEYHKLWRANNKERFNHLAKVSYHRNQAKKKGIIFDNNYLAEHVGHRKKQEPRVKISQSEVK
jgi:hypothetical protein